MNYIYFRKEDMVPTRVHNGKKNASQLAMDDFLLGNVDGTYILNIVPSFMEILFLIGSTFFQQENVPCLTAKIS